MGTHSRSQNSCRWVAGAGSGPAAAAVHFLQLARTPRHPPARPPTHPPTHLISLLLNVIMAPLQMVAAMENAIA